MQKNLKLQTINHKLWTGSQSGIAMVFSVIMLAVILATTVGLVSIFAPRLRTSSDVKNSVGALFAADSGAELCLYEARRRLPAPSPRITALLSGEATFTISSVSQQFGKVDLTADCRPLTVGGNDNFRFEVLGKYRTTNRALRVNQ